MLWPRGIGPDPRPSLFLPLWQGFLLGVGTFWVLRKRMPTFLFVAYAAIISASAIIYGNSFSVACAATAILIYAVGSTNRLHSLLNWGWVQGLGAISYSLYLIHNPITGATFRVGKFLGGHSVAWDALWWFLSLGACIASAAMMWLLVEKPSIGFARKIPLDF